MRAVRRAEREIEEERLLARGGGLVAHETDRMVHQVGGQVIALLRRGRRIHAMVVVHQVRMEVVGQGIQEAVEALEAASQRPLVVRPGRARLVDRRHVPLAHTHRAVAGPLQDLGDGAGLLADMAARIGKTAVRVGQEGHAHAVMIASGQQAGAGGRAKRRHVQVVVAQALLREPVDGRRLDGGAVAAEAGEADVVEQHHHHVGRILRRPRRRRPPGFGLLPGVADAALEAVVRQFLARGHAFRLLARAFCTIDCAIRLPAMQEAVQAL